MSVRHADARAAERWFLDRGLPSVLSRRARLRGIFPRSSPALSAFAIVAIAKLVIYWLIGDTRVNIDAIDITSVERIVLTILVIALPLAAVIGWSVARFVDDRRQWTVSAVAVVVAVACDIIQDDFVSAAGTCAIIGLILALTAGGIGSVLGWACRLTWSQLKAAGQLLIGVLPVVLLIVLVFFNTYLWLMAANITQRRLLAMLAVFVTIAIVFLVSRTLERAQPTLEHASASARHAKRLTGTPFEHLEDPAAPAALTRGERLNEVFILVATQVAQILTVALVSSSVFFVVGLLALSPEVLQAWTHGNKSDATMFDVTIPAPQALVNVTLFLAALTFMYISARAAGDNEYKSTFLDPLLADLKLTMLARNRYRHHMT